MKLKLKKIPPGNCSCEGAKLDRLLQPAILSVLAKEPLNGYRVGKALETLSMFKQRKPDASGMYRTLHDMEKKGLIRPASGSAKSDATVYNITACGAACLERWVKTLIVYQETVGELIGNCRSAVSTVKAS
jgi:PadR family transcriptional regulator AphA